jgi:3-oxoacyl-[acyl-carrier protein] reductase
MGIGAATSRRLASEGATVVIADRDAAFAERTVAAIHSAGGAAWFQPVDLADQRSIEAMGRAVAERTDRLHGLVNNAGIVRRTKIVDTGDDDWLPQTAINLRAPALCAKALLPLLKAGPGHIVNIASEAGFQPHGGKWVYDATKAGIWSLTRTMAVEFAEFGIRANTVAPGGTVTEMHFLKAPDPEKRRLELQQQVTQGEIMKRMARPEEIAAPIAFLLSDDASFITATTLHVDGGRVAH